MLRLSSGEWASFLPPAWVKQSRKLVRLVGDPLRGQGALPWAERGRLLPREQSRQARYRQHVGPTISKDLAHPVLAVLQGPQNGRLHRFVPPIFMSGVSYRATQTNRARCPLDTTLTSYNGPDTEGIT